MGSLKKSLVLSVVIVVLSGLSGRGELMFDTGGKFKIAQFTDLHWLASKTNNGQTLDTMAAILDAEQPDLVVLTGDCVQSGSITVTIWQNIVKVMQDRQIPWAVTLGNHDRESMTAVQDITALSSMPYSLVEMGPTNIGGAGNYLLTVKDSSGQHNAAAIYCMDSQSKGMSSAQVQWYRDQSAAMTQSNGGVPLPSLAFFHIPLPEYTYFDTSKVNGQIGQRGEVVCCENQTGEMFDAIEDSKDVMGVFCGHDHLNDFALFFDNVCLAYARKTGVNSYGSLPRGGRIIELTEGQPGFDSWLRIQDGTVLNRFHYQPVPEPSSLLLLLGGLACLAWLGRRRVA